MEKEKPQAVFIVGFNNWGKTEIIKKLFDRKAFTSGVDYPINKDKDSPEIGFVVQPASNDDITNAQNWINDVKRRIGNNKDANLLAALCPTYSAIETNEKRNNFIDLLNHHIFKKYSQLNLFLLENKYDHHAKLNVEEIVKASRQNERMKIIVINADTGIVNVAIANQDIYNQRLEAQVSQIIAEMHKIF